MFEKWRRRRAEQRTLDHWPTWGQTAGEMLPQSALAIADVWACVKVLADAAASVPLIATGVARTKRSEPGFSGRSTR